MRKLSYTREIPAIAIMIASLYFEYLYDFTRDCYIILIVLKDSFPDPVSSFDRWLLTIINPGLLSQYITPIMIFITLFGGWIFITGFMVALLIRMRRKAVPIVIVVVISLVFTYFLKELFARPRPFFTVPEVIFFSCSFGPSFPSGHMTRISAIAGAFSKIYSGWIKYLMILLSIFVGFSRLYLGVHYPSDIIAGGIIGYLVGYLLTPVIEDKLSLIIDKFEKTSSTP